MPTTKTVSVSAQTPWVDTGVDLTAGDQLILKASGTSSIWSSSRSAAVRGRLR